MDTRPQRAEALRFSLKELFALLTAAGVFCGALAQFPSETAAVLAMAVVSLLLAGAVVSISLAIAGAIMLTAGAWNWLRGQRIEAESSRVANDGSR